MFPQPFLSQDIFLKEKNLTEKPASQASHQKRMNTKMVMALSSQFTRTLPSVKCGPDELNTKMTYLQEAATFSGSMSGSRWTHVYCSICHLMEEHVQSLFCQPTYVTLWYDGWESRLYWLFPVFRLKQICLCFDLPSCHSSFWLQYGGQSCERGFAGVFRERNVSTSGQAKNLHFLNKRLGHLSCVLIFVLAFFCCCCCDKLKTK